MLHGLKKHFTLQTHAGDKTTAAHNQNSIVLFPPVPNAVYLNGTVFFWFPNVCLCRYKCLSYVEVLFTFLVKSWFE